VVNQPHGLRGAPIMNRVLKGIQDEPRLGGRTHPPAGDLARRGIDDESDIYKPLLGGDIGEVADPQHVGRRDAGLSVHFAQKTGAFLSGIIVRCGLPRMMP
jgi:hypothetical protein